MLTHTLFAVLAQFVIAELSCWSWQGCHLIDNADGTGRTLLDNAGAIIPSDYLKKVS